MSDSQRLLNLYQEGESAAAQQLFDRYVRRLLALTRKKLSPRLQRRIDAEDVVQSAYRSFFARAGQGDVVLQRAGDLWRLLAAITLNKLYRQTEKHSAAKRDFRREESASAEWPLGPSPEEDPQQAAAVVELVQQVMQQAGTKKARALEMRLQGHSVEEIAAAAECSQRTARRWLEEFRRELEKRFHEDAP